MTVRHPYEAIVAAEVLGDLVIEDRPDIATYHPTPTPPASPADARQETTVPQLTDQQRDEILAALARLTSTVQAAAEAVTVAFAPAVQAVAQQFAELQKALAPVGFGPHCCVCGTIEHGGSAFYENYRGQLFCWPCADGDRPCDCHQPPVRQSLHVDPAAEDLLAANLRAEGKSPAAHGLPASS